MATHNEKSPLTGNASGQRCAKRETGASTDTPSDVIGANAENFSAGRGHADSLTNGKRQAVGEALTEYFAALDRDMGIDTPDRILSLFDYHDSRNIDDLIDRAIAPTIAAFHVDQPAPITAQTALAAIETFEIVEDSNWSRKPNSEDLFVLQEFIAHLFGGYTVKVPATAQINEPSATDLITVSGDSLTLSGAQLLEALDLIAPDRDRDQLETELTFQRGDGHSGNGMYCWLTECPGEGALFVDGSTAIPTEAAPPPAGEHAKWIGPHRNGWEALNETRKAVAEVIGADPETWPDHGNAPLAIAAAIALRQQKPRADVTAAAHDEVAARAKLSKPGATLTAAEIAGLHVLNDKLRYVDDMGPADEGWQSDELNAAWAAVDAVLARAPSADETGAAAGDDTHLVTVDVRDLFAYLRAAWREGQHYDREDFPDQADSWSAASDYANKTIDQWTNRTPAHAVALATLTNEQHAAIGTVLGLVGLSPDPRVKNAYRVLRELARQPPEPRTAETAAARDVLAERRRQVDQEGWTPAHDDQYRDHELSCAAGCYAMHTLAYPAGNPPPAWPWAADWWKPTTHRRNLVKAGALIQAAIERLDRIGESQ